MVTTTELNRGFDFDGSDVTNVGAFDAGSVSTGKETLDQPVVRVYPDGLDTYADYPINEYADIGALINDVDGKFGGFGAGYAAIIPHGSYTFSNAIDLSFGAHLFGFGWERNTTRPYLTYEGAADAAVTVSNNAAITGLVIDASDEGGDVNGINATAALTLKYCTVTNCDRGVLVEDPAYYTSIEGCYITNCSQGILNNSNDVTIKDNNISGHSFNGVRIESAQGIWIVNNSIESNSAKGVFVDQGASPVDTVIIRDNYIEGNAGNAIQVSEDSGVVSGLSIKDNFIRGVDLTNEIVIGNTIGAEVSGNHIENASTCVFIQSSATEAEVNDEELMTVTSGGKVSDEGVRTLREGVGINSGDPSSAGEWNGNGREGIQVVDTTNNVLYTYRDGGWV